jgi:hypothetical protein
MRVGPDQRVVEHVTGHHQPDPAIGLEARLESGPRC